MATVVYIDYTKSGWKMYHSNNNIAIMTLCYNYRIQVSELIFTNNFQMLV